MKTFTNQLKTWAIVFLLGAVAVLSGTVIIMRGDQNQTSKTPQILVAGVYQTRALAMAGNAVITDTTYLGPGGYTWGEVLNGLINDTNQRQIAAASGVKIVGDNVSGAWVLYFHKVGQDKYSAPAGGLPLNVAMPFAGEYDISAQFKAPAPNACFTEYDDFDNGATTNDPAYYQTRYLTVTSGCPADVTMRTDGVTFKPVPKTSGGGNPTAAPTAMATTAPPTAAPTMGTGGTCDPTSILSNWRSEMDALNDKYMKELAACNCGAVVTNSITLTGTATVASAPPTAVPPTAPPAPTATVPSKVSDITLDMFKSWLKLTNTSGTEVDFTGAKVNKLDDNTYELKLPHAVTMCTTSAFDGSQGRLKYGGGLNGDWEDEFFTGPNQCGHNAETPQKPQTLDKVTFQRAGSY